MKWTLLTAVFSLPLFASPAEFDCQPELERLQNLPALPQQPKAWLQAVDSWRLPARNKLSAAYVYNDAASDPQSRQSARQCINSLSKAFEKHTNSLRSQAKALLPGASGLEARALGAWAGSTKALKSPEYRAVVDKGRKLSQRFRANIDNFEGRYPVPEGCQGKLPGKWQKSVPLRGGAVKAALNDVPPHCREALFVAYESRLSAANAPVLAALLENRQQQASLDGFKDYADRRLARTQLGSAEAVWRYLDKLSAKNRAAAEAERAALNNPPLWALQSPKVEDKPASYRPQTLIDNYFAWLGKALDLRFVPIEVAHPWAKGISGYELRQGQKAIGRLYLDLYPRDGKYGHNRHRELQRGVTGVQLPASVLVMNLPEDRWHHKDLKSLMHESGHALNNLLASQPYEILAGIRLPSDLVEVPSKVLEQLAWDPAIHQAITGVREAPPEDVRQQGIALDQRILNSAMALAYHQSGAPDMEAINARLYPKYLRQDYIKGLSPQYAFRHLASYGPAYFTYLYADAKASDISEAIAGGQLTLRRFADCMLSPGGSVPAREQLACATPVD
ncbi:M3 family metallopeptidase [Gallaecimonas pentaromativorans]|uniref:Peptidase M3-like protein n=1 Tax=Gallaecimonas pentaromativorans TaxID=584787 RepID=A0A3N1PV72_9GAMM|nr:M3 family metallopeptidase [Gallaecimonas pentaromativorans]ROQ28446.1 peptidase M3-like protein [Gallaecimonas pentaromativorans]